MKKLIAVFMLLVIATVAQATQTNNTTYSDPAVQALSPLLDHTHEVDTYTDTNQKDVDWGQKAELVVYKSKSAKYYIDEIRVDASHSVERGEYEFYVVARVPLYKLWGASDE